MIRAFDNFSRMYNEEFKVPASSDCHWDLSFFPQIGISALSAVLPTLLTFPECSIVVLYQNTMLHLTKSISTLIWYPL